MLSKTVIDIILHDAFLATLWLYSRQYHTPFRRFVVAQSILNDDNLKFVDLFLASGDNPDLAQRGGDLREKLRELKALLEKSLPEN